MVNSKTPCSIYFYMKRLSDVQIINECKKPKTLPFQTHCPDFQTVKRVDALYKSSWFSSSKVCRDWMDFFPELRKSLSFLSAKGRDSVFGLCRHEKHFTTKVFNPCVPFCPHDARYSVQEYLLKQHCQEYCFRGILMSLQQYRFPKADIKIKEKPVCLLAWCFQVFVMGISYFNQKSKVFYLRQIERWILLIYCYQTAP